LPGGKGGGGQVFCSHTTTKNKNKITSHSSKTTNTVCTKIKDIPGEFDGLTKKNKKNNKKEIINEVNMCARYT